MAASLSKMIKRSGGFKQPFTPPNDWTSCPFDVPDTTFKKKKQKLELANQAHPSIVKRGGACGIPKWQLEFHSDTQAALRGVNILNTN